ncbi:MAG: two-component system response regulator HydG, partial [Bradymonadia bacterium]
MTSASQASRVLVVDDDVEHGKTLQRLLRREGHEVIAVEDASHALRLLRAETYDAVVTDLVMPGQSGLDLLKAMKHLEIHVDVILMTAFGTVERAVEAMQAGAVDFIVKPIKRA